MPFFLLRSNFFLNPPTDGYKYSSSSHTSTYEIHVVFRFYPRSRCNSSSRCCYRARKHVDPVWSRRIRHGGDMIVLQLWQQLQCDTPCPYSVRSTRYIIRLSLPPPPKKSIKGRLLCRIFWDSEMDPFCPLMLWLHFWTSLYECRISCAALCENKHFTFFVFYGDHTYHVSGTGTRYL